MLLSAIVVTTNAQFGVKAGVNFANLHGSDVSGVKGIVGFYAGANYNISINEMFNVQTEAVYSSEGAKDSGGSDDKIILGFINLSALFRYNSSGFFIGTGPQYGIIASAKEKISGTSTDIKDQLKSGDFSWAFAAGYDLPVGLGFDARYNLGLGSIGKEQSGVTPDIKTGCFQVGVHYNFKMGEQKGKKK